MIALSLVLLILAGLVTFVLIASIVQERMIKRLEHRKTMVALAANHTVETQQKR